jgi:PKHD-type hydroxylase
MAVDYWLWENAVPHELCDMAIKSRENFTEDTAKIGTGMGDFNVEYRQSKVVWLQSCHWLEGILCNYGMSANLQAGWNYELLFPENIQLTKYEINGHYNFHSDALIDDSAYIRKISVVLLLNDPSEFEGGEFEFFGVSSENIKLTKGSLLAFPSFITHRVAPVKRGVRHSAVTWIKGIRK